MTPAPKPITVIAGFLGAGKTTLVNQLLADPSMADTALIINEFGEVGIDESLIVNATDTLIELANGCVCCVLQGTLAETIAELGAQRRSESSPFERVLVETTGLANVGPIIHTVVSDHRIAEHFFLDGVLTVVDAIHGDGTLDRHPESVEQVAVADVIVVSKAELAPPIDHLLDRVRNLARTSEIVVADHGRVHVPRLFSRAALERTLLAPEIATASSPLHHDEHPHDVHMSSVSVSRNEPLAPDQLEQMWAAVADHNGANLLRVKGLVNVTGRPGPAIVQGVQDTLSAVEWLPSWPSDDRSTRIVFIGWDLDRAEIDALVP